MLSNYTNISSAVAAWLNRVGASDVTDNVEDFITLAQRRLQRDVRVPPMEVSAQLTITSGQAAIPTAMLDVKEMVADDGTTAWDIKRATFSDVLHARNTSQKGPQVFDTVGGNFEFGPDASSGVTVTAVYYQELEFISSTVAENWFSQYAPETILYGALAEAGIFTKDEGMAAIYDKKYSDAVQALKIQKQQSEWSGRLEVRRK